MPFEGVEWKKHTQSGTKKNLFGQNLKKNDRLDAMVGFRYTLPMLFVAEARVNTSGRIRLQLEREDISLTNRLRMGLKVNTDKEYDIGLNYIVSSWCNVTAVYNSELKWGAGVRLIY